MEASADHKEPEVNSTYRIMVAHDVIGRIRRLRDEQPLVRALSQPETAKLSPEEEIAVDKILDDFEESLGSDPDLGRTKTLGVDPIDEDDVVLSQDITKELNLPSAEALKTIEEAQRLGVSDLRIVAGSLCLDQCRHGRRLLNLEPMVEWLELVRDVNTMFGEASQ